MKKSILSTVVAALLLSPFNAEAATTAYAEKAQLQGSGKVIRAYRLPTKDSNGATKYRDVVVTLSVAADGSIDPANSTITSTSSPTVSGTSFVNGTYIDHSGNTCTLTTSTLLAGRQQAAVSCVNSAKTYITSLDWSTGPIAGHPYELNLNAAKIGDIPGYQNYAWGLAGNTPTYTWGCFSTNDIVSARQVGTQLTISSYNLGNTAACSITLTKQ